MESDKEPQSGFPDELPTSNAKKPLSSEVEEHMCTAARMMYDIIREWRARHTGKVEQHDKQDRADSN